MSISSIYGEITVRYYAFSSKFAQPYTQHAWHSRIQATLFDKNQHLKVVHKMLNKKLMDQ